MRPPRRHYVNSNYDIGALEQRVYGVEKGLTSLIERMDRLAEALEKRASPQWQALSVGLTFIGMIGAIVYLLIQAQIAAVEGEGRDAKAAVGAVAEILRESYVPRVELNDWRAELRSETIENAGDIAQVRAEAVSRAEYAERLRGVDERMAAQQGQIDEVRRQFGGAYSIGDALAALQERMQRLEGVVLQLGAASTIPPSVQGPPGG